MKIYITGIAGMLGYNLYKTLCAKADITGVDIEDVDIPGLTYQKFSLLDNKALRDDLEKEMPDILIHTAAMVNVDGCEENPVAADQMNVVVTRNIAQLCYANNIKMVYISTDAVFDGESEALYAEKDVTNPVNVYGRTKLEGEKEVLKYSQNLVLRTNIYGLNIQDKYSFGEWIYYSLKGNCILNMFTDIDFSPIIVNELAEIIYEACSMNLCGVYHACATGCITKYEFAVKLKEIFKIDTGIIRPSVSENANFKAKRSKHMGMSNKKLAEKLGINISTPEESLYKFNNLLIERGSCDGN